MAFDATAGGDPRGPWCKACRSPITEADSSEQVTFNKDEHGMSGLYHKHCARPFASIARFLNYDPGAGR